MLTGPTDQMSETQKQAFNTSLGTVKIGDKTVLELARSSDATDKKKAIRATKQIVKSILEAEVLRFDDQGNITGIEQ